MLVHTPHAVASWVTSAPVRALVASFARDLADHALVRDLAHGDQAAAPQLLDRLAAYSTRWDTRRGRERDQAGALPMTPRQRATVLAAAGALGMRGANRRRFRRYDHLLILGGALRGCVARTAHAADLVRSGRVHVTRGVTALGGYRPFSPAEREAAAACGAPPELTEEFAALDHHTRAAFGLGEPTETLGSPGPLGRDAWRVRHYAPPPPPRVRVVAAPSSAPATRRANTADTYAFFTDHLAALHPGARLLVVTAAINVPAQHAGAVRHFTVPYGAEVDTVGTPPDAAPPPLRHHPTATEYLQETRSTILALRDLLRAATTTAAT